MPIVLFAIDQLLERAENMNQNRATETEDFFPILQLALESASRNKTKRGQQSFLAHLTIIDMFSLKYDGMELTSLLKPILLL